MSLRIEQVGHVEQLSESILRQWERLPLPSPMQSPAWLLTWWEVFGKASQDELRLLLILEGDRLVGLAPWYLSHGFLGPAPLGNLCLRFLGDGQTCSDHASVITERGYESQVAACLAEWLQREAGCGWHALQLEAVDDDDQQIQQLLACLSDTGLVMHHSNTSGCWSVELPETWAEYLGQLSKNHRKRCRRWERKYFNSQQAQIRVIEADELNRGWDRLAELNRQRREQKGDRSVFADPDFHQFHLQALASLVPRRQANLRELVIEGEVVAAEYVLCDAETVFCYQSGMQAGDHPDGYGNLSILALIRDAVQHGYRRIDFLRGDEDYKHHWGATRTGCRHITIGATSLSGTAQVAYTRTVDWMRGVKNSLLAR